MIARVTPPLPRPAASPAADFLSAFRLFLSPQCKLPIWDFIKYFAGLGATRAGYVGEKRTVDFSAYFRAYDKTTASLVPYRQMLERIVELLELKGGEWVVDLASGTGNLSLLLKAKGADVLSLDCLAAAGRIHQEKDPAARTLLVNLDRPDSQLGFIPLPDQSVDRVGGSNFRAYIKNPQTLWQEVKRILKPGGFMVIDVEKTGHSPTKILIAHLTAEYQRYRRQGEAELTAAVKVYCDFIANYEALLITAEETKKFIRGLAVGEYTSFLEPQIRQELAASGWRVVQTEAADAGQAIIVKAFPA